jgi:hypothetical protein
MSIYFLNQPFSGNFPGFYAHSWMSRFGMTWLAQRSSLDRGEQEQATPPDPLPSAGDAVPEAQATMESEATAEPVPNADAVTVLDTNAEPASQLDEATAEPATVEETAEPALQLDEPTVEPATVETPAEAANVEAPADVIKDLLLGDPFRLNASQSLGTATSVTYAFLDEVPGYYKSYDWANNDFRPFSVQQQEMTRGVLAMIEGFSGLTFVETDADAASITFGLADLPGDWAGYAYYPGEATVNRKAADVWVDSDWAGKRFTPGTEPYKTLLHEIGHAIGLDHPGSAFTKDEDSRMYTVMSSNSHPDAAGEPQTYMPYDIAAVQHLYGTGTGHAAGNKVYDFAALDGRIQTLWDTNGIDTLDLSDAPFAVTLDLRQGAFSTVAESDSNNLAVAYGTTIKNAIGGAGNDTLIGNPVGNRLAGGPGNDLLTGGGGKNEFVFEAGWGRDTINGFHPDSDRLDFRDTGLVFADLQILFAENATIVAHGNDRITLPGVDHLDESAFLFGQTALIA